ncbi:MAG: hypothetical protein ABIJ21_00480 [Nanoarchaeota archaeon]
MRAGLIPSTIIILFIFLLFLPQARAETSIYSAWHHSGDSFTIILDNKEEINYLSYFIYERRNDAVNKLFWKRGTKGMTFNLGECKTDVFYKFCFEDASWQDSTESGHLIYQHGEEYPGVKIGIYKFGPDITAERTSEEGTTLNIFQETKIHTKLKNSGDRRADIIYEEYPPSLANVLRYNGYTRDPVEKFLHWEGFLTPNQIAPSLTYRIKPLTYEPFTIPAFLTFDYEGRTTNVSVGTLSFTITTPYTFSSSLGPASVGLYETSKISLSYKNTDKYRSMTATIRLSIPKELDIVSKPTWLAKQGDYYVSTMKLPSDKDYSFEMTVRGGSTGTYNITAFAELDFGDEQFTLKESHLLAITASTITPKIRLIDPSVEGGTKVRLVAELQNMDDFQNLQNINAKVSGPLLAEPIAIRDPLLEYSTLNKYVDEYLTTPITNTKLEYRFWLNGTYELASDEKNNFSAFAILTINPAGGDHFEITQEVSEETLARGDNLTIKTFLKNLKDYNAFKIDIKDTISEGVPVIAGTRKNMLDLQGQEKKQVYLYMLEVPHDYLDPTITITTQVKFQEYEVAQEKIITVISPVNDTPSFENATTINQTNVTIPEDTSEDEPVILTQKKEGFLVRVVNSISDFLKKIF